MDESMPQSSDVDASPASFNLSAGFSEVVILLFVSLVIYPILSLFWDIPQLQAEEKN
jgi:nitrate reductase NapE component